ncbi:unnamed protein product [Ectocarpus sp. CCAP 1310/34]|nr:unnamed protein product [Ectocarpus sp. CCAP 1310/34]
MQPIGPETRSSWTRETSANFTHSTLGRTGSGDLWGHRVGVVMGCGCSTHKRRVAAAKKEDQGTSVQTVGTFTPTTPKASPHANKPTPAPSPPKQQREFLKGMSPSSSFGGDTLGPSPVTPESANVLAATGTPPPTVSHEKGSDTAPESDVAVTLVGVASSNSDHRLGEAETGAIKDETEKEEGRMSRKRSIKLVSQPGEPQVRLPRLSNQDSLPQIVPTTRGSADLLGILSRGNTLGPGLDTAFREDPTYIVVPTEAATAVAAHDSGAISSSDKRSEDRPTGVIEIPATHRNDNTINEEFVMTPVTPEDTLDKGVLEEQRPVKDRWPWNNRARESPETTRRGHHNNDNDGPPPRLEARPALAAGAPGEVNTATDSSNHGGRRSLSVVDFPGDDPCNDLSAGGGLHSSDAGETWGATSGALSLLDADEEDFMETLLMES